MVQDGPVEALQVDDLDEYKGKGRPCQSAHQEADQPHAQTFCNGDADDIARRKPQGPINAELPASLHE